jgi:hypothetical protein
MTTLHNHYCWSSFKIIIHGGTNDIPHSSENEMSFKFAHLIHSIQITQSELNVEMSLYICTLPPNYTRKGIADLVHLVNSNLLASRSSEYKIIDLRSTSYPKSAINWRDKVHYSKKGARNVADAIAAYFRPSPQPSLYDFHRNHHFRRVPCHTSLT